MVGDGGDDEDSGVGRRRQVSDDEILTALETGKERINAPALSTSDVAGFVPISRQAVKGRLEDLADEGRVGMHKAGRNRFWWLADDAHSAGEFDIDDAIETGDLSDDKLIHLFSEQIDVEELPANLVDEIIKDYLTPHRIDNETLFEALRQNVDYAELPDDITSDIAMEVYGYDTSFWANQTRTGIVSMALTTIFAIFTLILISINPPDNLLGLISGGTILDILTFLAQVGAFVVLVTLASGVIFLVFGIGGRAFSSTDDPRPWRDYIRNVIRSYLF